MKTTPGDVPLKTRLAIMWVFIAFVGTGRAMATGLQELSAGKVSPELSPAASLWGGALTLAVFAIPVLCVVLSNPWNRRANILLGFFFTIAGVAGTGAELSTQPVASDAGIYLMDAAATIAPAMVIYWAYRWPK